MFWEKIIIESSSTIVLERDIVNDVIRWSVEAADRSTTTGEAPTLSAALAMAIKAADDQQRQITDRALKEFLLFDHFDR